LYFSVLSARHIEPVLICLVLRATAFNKISKVDHVDAVVGGTWDFLVESIFPLAKRDKIFALSPSNPEEVLSEASRKNPYALLNSMSIQAGEDVLEPFLSSAGKKKFSLVTMQVPFSAKYSEMYRRVSARVGHEFIEEIEISLEDSPQAYKHAAQKLSRKNPDIIFIVADYPRLDIFMTELQNFKVSPIIITTQHLEGAFELSGNNQDRYKNCFSIHPKYDHEKFDPLYLKHFNKKPGVFAAEGFDAVQFLARAFNRPEKSIFGFSYTGLKGSYSYKQGKTSLLEKNEAVLVNFQNQKLTEVRTLPGN